MASTPVVVSAGQDRTGSRSSLWGIMPFDVKVRSSDSDGAMFAFEHPDLAPGGPPRHIHIEQDEFFQVNKGTFLFEIDGEKHTLRTGDTLFVPRGVPHGWACSEGPGSILVTLTPAGTFEAFFREQAEVPNMPPPDEAARIFEQHGMQIVGPPLELT